MSATLISSAGIRLFDTPFRRPFVTALGRKTSTRNAAIRLTLKDGSVGYGEASSSLAQADAPESLEKALRNLGRASLGRDARALRSLSALAWEKAGASPPSVAAFECALVSAAAASAGILPFALFGGSLKRIESDITLSASSPEEAGTAAREAWKSGFRTFKVKVRGDLKTDLARIRSAFNASGRRARMIIDGNQGFTAAGALRLLEGAAKARVPVDLLEQPVAKDDLKAMAFVTRRSPVPVAADESVRTPADALKVADLGAASVINVKLAKSGIVRGLEICALARAAGLELMIGCMAETGRGLSASVHLALGTGFFRYVDLDSDVLLAGHERLGGGGAAPEPKRDWTRRGRYLSVS